MSITVCSVYTVYTKIFNLFKSLTYCISPNCDSHRDLDIQPLPAPEPQLLPAPEPQAQPQPAIPSAVCQELLSSPDDNIAIAPTQDFVPCPIDKANFDLNFNISDCSDDDMFN